MTREILKSASSSAKDRIGAIAVRYLGESAVDTFGQNTPLKFSTESSEFDDRFQQAIENGFFPVPYGSIHGSPWDGIPLAKAISYLVTLAPNRNHYDLPVAITMGSGHQGKTIKAVTDIMHQKLPSQHVYPFNYVRAEDARHGFSATEAREEFERKVQAAMRNIWGFAIFPEGKMDAGRQKNNGRKGEINGMIRFKPALKYILDIAKKQGQECVFIPIALFGSHNILDPNRKGAPTKHALLAAILAVATKRFTDKLLIKPPSVSVTIGLPIESTDLVQLITRRYPDVQVPRSRIDDLLAEEAAVMLPQHARGYYTEHVAERERVIFQR